MKQVKFRIVQTILPLLIGMFLSLGAYAQQITVKGHVKDAMGEPVIGANVIAKGTTTGTITDFDGNFTLFLKILFCPLHSSVTKQQKLKQLLR